MGGTCCVSGREKDQVGRSILWLPWFMVDRFLDSIN